MHPDEDQILIEGEEAPPELSIIPSGGEDIKDDDTGDMVGLVSESFEADLADEKGLGGVCG